LGTFLLKHIGYILTCSPTKC